MVLSKVALNSHHGNLDGLKSTEVVSVEHKRGVAFVCSTSTGEVGGIRLELTGGLSKEKWVTIRRLQK